MKLKEYLASYEVLKHHFDEGRKFFIEIYHHDDNGEPSTTVEAYPEIVKVELIGGVLIIAIQTDESSFTFSPKNYNTNLSDDTVVFSSKKR